MSDTSIDEIIPEDAFAVALDQQSANFFRLASTLLEIPDEEWTRDQPYQLGIEANSLESFLDDHGARYNRTFHFFRKLVASVRSIALASFALTHLERRLSSYQTNLHQYPRRDRECRGAIRAARAVVQQHIRSLLDELLREARAIGFRPATDVFPPALYKAADLRKRLPRNLGESEISEEEQRIAEVASKYLEVCTMFEKVAVRRIDQEEEREAFLSRQCSEERARVYEATVHNLQSAYDTHVKNTHMESEDARLPRLRGHASAAFHLLEAVTHLVHFYERHLALQGEEGANKRIALLVDPVEVRAITLNHLLYWAAEFMELGRPLAEEVLRSYTNVQDLVVEISGDMVVHARPAALIVSIVNHYGTPVEMEVGGTRCNAGSILDLMVAVGSNPGARRYVFRGDENPLRDIGMLFENGLGENGTSELPDELAYLRGA